MEFNQFAYYGQMAYVHGLTGLIGKISLGCVLAMVAAGNKKPGEQLLATIIALQFLMSGYLAYSSSADYAAQKTIINVIAVLCVVLGLAIGISLFYREGEWNLRPHVAWRKWVGAGLIAWGLYFPPFNDNWLRAIFLSPISVLPHPTLIAAGAAAWLSLPNINRLIAWTLAIGLIVLGIMDLAAGIFSSSLLLALGLLLGGEMLKSSINAGGITADDVPPVDRERHKKVRLVKKEKSEPERTWKLK